MKWQEIRQHYPDQWLIIEALEAETGPTQQRQIKRMGVVEQCTDGSGALSRYRELHAKYPQREFYFVHTSQEALDIKERTWIGIRNNYNLYLSFPRRRESISDQRWIPVFTGMTSEKTYETVK